MQRCQHSRCAESALQRMMLSEGTLQRRQLIAVCEAFDRHDGCSGGLDGEQKTRPDRPAVDDHGTGAANAVFASRMRAGEIEMIPQTIAQRRARCDVGLDGLAVDFKSKLHDARPRIAAAISVRSTSVPTSARR